MSIATRRSSWLANGAFAAVVVLAVVYTMFPIYWAVNTSLLPRAQLAAVPAVYIPSPPDVSSYRDVLANTVFLAGLRNSAIVAVGATLMALALGSLAACALGRYQFAGRKPVLYLILAMTMFPQVTILGSLFTLITTAGLYNNPLALVLSYQLTTLPFTIWVMAGFFRSLPRDLEESAYVDGASPLQAFWFVLLPLSAPGLVTTGLLAFVSSWNEYLFALAFTIDETARTAPVVIAQFSGAAEYEIPWGLIMAGAIIATAPLVVLVLIFQRRIVAGLTAGAVKG